MRPIEIAYWLQRKLWHLVRPSTTGVKVLLFDPNKAVALIRNAYGRSDLFVLPGGGVRLFEKPEAAAVREVREELGLEATEIVLRSVHHSSAEGKSDTIYLFTANARGELRIDETEVAEAGFFALEELPEATSSATRRRIDEHLGRRRADQKW